MSSRRELLKHATGIVAGAYVGRWMLLGASDNAQCLLTPEQTIGPYYLDRETVRYDLTEGKPGLPLKLRIAVMDVSKCAPVRNAALDVWHCDASGVYSGFTAHSPDGPPGGGPPPSRAGFGPRPGPPSGQSVDKTNFLRGVQLTDAKGVAEFATLYPGWYSGRTTHIHVRVRIGGAVDGATYRGGHVSHTGQIFLPDDVCDHVARLDPYRNRHAVRMRLSEDSIYSEVTGGSPMLAVSAVRDGSFESGLTGTIVLGIDPRATPAIHDDFGPPGRRPGFSNL